MGGEHFGPRLRELREAAGLTQQELAARVGVQWETISRWERGTREPSWSNVLAMASALGVDCRAFDTPATEAPLSPEPQQRGRPRKAEAREPASPPTAEVEDLPPPQKKPARRKPKPRGS